MFDSFDNRIHDYSRKTALKLYKLYLDDIITEKELHDNAKIIDSISVSFSKNEIDYDTAKSKLDSLVVFKDDDSTAKG